MKKIFFMFLCFYALPSLAIESVVLEKSRIIYHEGDRETNIGIENKSLKNSYLIQAWIENEEHHITNEFIVTPPLYVSRPRAFKNVEIWKVSNNLPSDREVLYYFFEKAIPSLNKRNAEHNGLSIATGNRIKFIFRPSGLQWNVHDAPGALVFKRDGENILLKNPSPYYITMTKLNILGRELGDLMIAPKSTININGNKSSVEENKVTYNIIDDFGIENGPYEKDIM